MTAQIIDGKLLAQELRLDIAQKVKAFIADTGVHPCLAVLLVGQDEASHVYVRNKISACEKAGILSKRKLLTDNASNSQVLQWIKQNNEDASVHGILLQLPLPSHLNSDMLLTEIAAVKDVDGFHASNAGALMLGNPGFVPCTPSGIMQMLTSANIPISGAHAVVVGRSNIVGKPMAMLLLAQNATVTICHSRTRDLAAQTRQADILIAAVGRPKMITSDMIKPGAAVIDVGMNRDAEGKLCGDVDFASALHTAGWLSPVPGGVGPMTITMLLANTLLAAKKQK